MNAAVTLLLIAFTSGSLDVRNGTLFITVRTDEGFLICADRQISDDSGKPIEEMQKIMPLENGAMFIVTGKGRFVTEDNITVFDANRITSQYFLNKKVETADWSQLLRQLDLQFNNMLSNFSFETWPENPPQSEPLFTINIFFVDSLKQIGLARVFLYYSKQDPPIINVRYGDALRAEFNRIMIWGGGEIDVYKEIKSGKRPEFDDVRSDAIIKKFFSLIPSNRRPKLKESIQFAKKMIVLTHERSNILDKVESKVGSTCDCGTLNPKEGFRWIEKHR